MYHDEARELLARIRKLKRRMPPERVHAALRADGTISARTFGDAGGADTC